MTNNKKPKKQVNYAQVFGAKERNKERIRKMCPNAYEKSGIYWFFRTDSNNIRYGYIGKSEHSVLSRMADHLAGFDQHIDRSIRKYGVYHEQNNPYGYRWGVVCYCNPEECDELETKYIKEWADKGVQLRNTQSGGTLGRTNINENKPSKTYRDGIVQGQKTTRAKVQTYFTKYLDYSVKLPSTKIKEKKFAEFKQFLEGNTEGGTD